MTTPAAPPTTEKTKQQATYVVLEQMGEATWAFMHNIQASSSDQAIRKTVQNAGGDYKDSKHTLVAVPARSFVPVKVTVETKTTIKLG